MQLIGYGGINLIGLHACQAAYETGQAWLEELKVYLRGNLDYVREYLNKNLPVIRLIEPEGTYLIWLDCRGLGLSEEDLEHLIVQEAKLWLDAGAMFGTDGEGFERINIACPRSVLAEAMERLKRAVDARQTLTQ